MRFWDLTVNDFAEDQTRALGDSHLDSSQFLRLLLRLKVFRSITLKYLHDSNAEYRDGAIEGCFKTFDLIRLSRTVQRTYFIIYEFCFTCFKVECKRSYIFQSSSNETIIEI